MKNSVLIFCTIVNVLVTLIALIFVFNVDVTWTGPLGDTFGGLLSPIIGGISIYFIYQTFKAQREQLKDQREQFDVSRITNIIYLQIQRMDQTLENQTFFPKGGIVKVVGVTGVYDLNETLRDVFDSEQFARDSDGLELKNENLDHYLTIINDNLKPLSHFYGVILNSLKIIDISVDSSNLLKEGSDELKRLFLMNLDGTISSNINKLLWAYNDIITSPQYNSAQHVYEGQDLYEGQGLFHTLEEIQHYSDKYKL